MSWVGLALVALLLALAIVYLVGVLSMATREATSRQRIRARVNRLVSERALDRHHRETRCTDPRPHAVTLDRNGRPLVVCPYELGEPR
jgi:hypothetical protein